MQVIVFSFPPAVAWWFLRDHLFFDYDYDNDNRFADNDFGARGLDWLRMALPSWIPIIFGSFLPATQDTTLYAFSPDR